MSFLQPWMLFALPLLALPIVIHLMNQRRFQTMEWGAMIFLLKANQMARGFARVRRWLILAARTLVIAALIFGVARPLASGWLGLAAGNRTDTTIVLLDRSPSMTAKDSGNVASKLDTGRKQLAQSLEKLKSDHWILIDSATGKPTELASSQDLLSAANAEPAGASADLPTMLQSARAYIDANQTGRTDIWICSDLRQNDWDAEGGRWSSVRESFLESVQSIRFYLLAFPDLPTGNRSIRVTNVKRKETESGAELLVSLNIKRTGKQDNESIPLEFNIDGARSVVNVDLQGAKFELSDHRIPLGGNQIKGWGRVSIPADSVAPDNDFFFVFDEQPMRRTLLVTDVPEDSGPLELAAEIPSELSAENSVEVIHPRQLDSVAWDEIGMVLWQAPLPKAADSLLLQSFVDDDGRIIFLPPRTVGNETCFGINWKAWQPVSEATKVTTWRGDAGLLSNTQNGMALPMGELGIKNICILNPVKDQPLVPLASLSDGKPVLMQSPTDRGGVYALSTNTMSKNSTLAADGVVLYVMIQRALYAGSTRLADVEQGIAGVGDYDSVQWQRLAGADEALSSELRFHSGVFQSGNQLIAFNRGASEDAEQVLTGEEVDTLFGSLPFVRVEKSAGASSSLIREVWRLFLILMLIAMVAEAVLCMPPKNSEIPTLGGAKGAVT